MSEIQVASAAFDSELSKQLACLPPTPQVQQHDLVKEHHRGIWKLQELIEYYVKKLPPFAFGPRLLAAGSQLVSRQEYDLAISSCFRRLADLNLPAAGELSKLDATGKVSLHVQALYGLHSSCAARSLLRDPRITHANTRQTLVAALDGIQAACLQAMPHAQLYWLVYNATVHLHAAAAPLVTAGFHQEALPYYVFAAKALESHLQLSATAYLPWRLQMYAAAAHCYCALLSSASSSPAAAAPPTPTAADSTTQAAAGGKPVQVTDSSQAVDVAGVASQAQQFLQDGLADISNIIRAQALDPVPPPPAVTTALDAARAQLLLLKALFNTTAAPTYPADGPQVTSSKESILDALRPLGMGPSKLTTLLGLLISKVGNSQQPLQQVQLPANLQPVLDAAVELAKPLLELASSGAAGGQSAVTSAENEASGLVNAGTAVPEQLHMSFICVAYRFNQKDLLQSLLAAAHARLLTNSDNDNSLLALTAVMESLQQLDQDPGEASLLRLATCLQQCSQGLGGHLPGLVTAAALKLHAAAAQLLQGCFSQSDGHSDTVLMVLEGLHEALQQCNCDDGVMRGTVALRLVLLLVQQGGLDQARTVIQQGLTAISAARCDALRQLDGASDEHMRWITGSVIQANPATAALVTGMTQSDQEIACIHADALLVQQRLELSAGLKEVAANTAMKQQQMIASTIKREKQSDIYGARTAKDKRMAEAAIEAAGKPPSNAAATERQLLLDCSKNNYQKALLLTQIAAYQPDLARQAALLEEACDLLQAAQASEAELFAAQQPSAAAQATSHHHGTLLQPKILCRTPNSITLTHHPVTLKGYKQPVSFAAYCKPTGAGIGLTINRTAMEHPGSGLKVPLGSRVTIEGLQSNETYIFAIAVYDDQGNLMGELGPSTPNLLMALPLPLYSCWAHVLLTAAQLKQWEPAKRAASILLPQFIVASPARPIWQEHPMDRHQLQMQQVSVAPVPLLRLLVLAVYVYAGHLGQKLQDQLLGANGMMHTADAAAADDGVASKLAGTAASRELLLQCSESQVPGQVALLEACKRIIAAMQVAVVIGDEMLVEEGALRAYNLLIPLLQQRDISPLVHQALSNFHLALTAVKDTATSSITGHSKQRKTAARASAATSYWLMRLSAPLSPDLASGALAGAAGTVTSKVLQPASFFARLDNALLKALVPATTTEVAAPESAATGKVTARGSAAGAAAKAGKGPKKEQAGAADAVTAGQGAAGPAASAAEPVGAEELVELNAAQDYVLSHPDGTGWTSPAVAPRLQDAGDLPAQVLPKLSKPDVLANCWPLLAPEAARSHPRWLPLCVLVLDAAAKQHGAALLLVMATSRVAGSQSYDLGLGLTADALADLKLNNSPGLLAAGATASELVAAVIQHARLSARIPQLLEWPREPRWTIEAADAAALASSGFVLGAEGTAAEPPAPELAAGTPIAGKADALAAWEQEKAEVLTKERRRLAAAHFLQQRLPVLLQRRRSILHTRQQLAAWAPWLAFLHSLLGGLAAEAAATIAAHSAPAPTTAAAAATADAADDDEPLEPAESATAAASADVAPQPVADTTASSAATAASAAGQALKKPAGGRASKVAGKGGQVEAPTTAELMRQLSVQALQQFAQAATLAARAGPSAWQELFNSCKRFWNASRFIINSQPTLTVPLAAVSWLQGLLPGPKVPPLVAEAAARTAPADATAKGKAAGDKKAGDKGPAAAGDKKAGAAGGGKGSKSAAPEVPARQALVPEARGANAAIAVSAVAEAILLVLSELRAGATFHPRVIPVTPSTATDGTQPSGNTYGASNWAGNNTGTAAVGLNAGAAKSRPTSARSQATAGGATEFSLGSDAVVLKWHTGAPVDMESLTRVVLLVLKVLQKMERWNKAMDIGCRWLDICEGSADASLLPVLLAVAPKLGNPNQVAMLTVLQQALVRDKNAAFDALDKVRAMVLDRLTRLPLLSQQAGTLRKPARKAAPTSQPGNLTNRTNQFPSSTGGLGPEPSEVSMVSSRSRRAVANEVVIPAEYEKVIELLSKRGEKGHMILALNELGDVHAQFGNWSAASDAWNAALDALLGPYQVVNSWTTKLTPGTWQQLLARYGAHGLLLAGALLGKLARYIHPSQLNSRLSCARLAAEVVPAALAADIIHPQRAVDCAMYTPVEIWPGVDLFDDPYRCNAPDLLSGLETLSSILLEHQLCLPLLPLLSLWEHLALHVVHNSSSVLCARVTRVKALAQLGLLAEAGVVLQGLIQGRNLPGILLHGPQPLLGPEGSAVGLLDSSKPAGSVSTSGGKAAATPAVADAAAAGPPLYDASQWPGHANNAAFLWFVSDVVLHPAVAEAYGPWVCGQVALARAAWLTAAGSVANCWRTTDPLSVALVSSPFNSSNATNAAGGSAAGTGGDTGPQAAAPTGKDAATAGKDAGTAAAQSADAVEARLLDRAAKLVQNVVAASRKAAGLAPLSGSFDWDLDGDAAADGAGIKKSSSPAKGSKAGKGAAAAKGKAGKGAAKQGAAAGTAAVGAGAEAGSEAPTAEQMLLQQQHQQLVVEGLMLLSQVELARWMPSQALQLTLALISVISSLKNTSDAANNTAAGGPQYSMAAAGSAGGSRNDGAGRISIKPSIWLAARSQLATVLLQLKHYPACVAVSARGLVDSSKVADVLWAAQLQHVKANALAATGDAAEAVNVMRDAMSRLQQLSLSNSLLLNLQLDCALLCDELGARGEVDSLAGAAMTTSNTLMEQAGLQEMLDHPERLNLYLSAVPRHISALLLTATNSTRRRQLATSERLLRQAAVLLTCTRSLPTQHAEVALQLARVLRLQAALKLPATDWVVGGIPAAAIPRQGIGLHQQRLQEAAQLLGKALKLLITDGGSHPQLVRTVLLELAATTLYSYQLLTKDGTAAADGEDAGNTAASEALATMLAALQAAHVTAGHVLVLYLTSHQLQPLSNPSSSLPAWLLVWLKGQEQLQLTLQDQSSTAAASAAASAGKPHNSKQHKKQQQELQTGADSAAATDPAAPIPDATLGRLAVCYYVQKMTAAAEGLAGLQQRHAAAAQALLVQAALAKSCPKLMTECCWAQVPAVGSTAAAAAGAAGQSLAPPPGGVFLQWYRQDCCWQVPGSWRSDGSLPPASSNTHITRAILHQLPAQPAYASCIYVLNVPAGGAASPADNKLEALSQQQQQLGGLLVGEVVVNLDRLKRIQLQVKALRRRLESRGLPTDLFAAGTPSAKELASAKHYVEGMLAGIDEEDMPQPPADLPAASTPATAPPAAAPAVPAAATGAAKPAAAAAGKAGSAAGNAAGQKQQAGPAPTAATVGASCDSAVLDWRDVSTWVKLEALLDVEDGLQGVEGGVAAWLAGVLQQQQLGTHAQS